MVEISNITLSFGGKTVLDDASISCADGEIVGIIGPAGSGKSSLLLAAAGRLKSYRGSVLLDRRDIKKMNKREKERSVSFFNGASPLNIEDTLENFVVRSRVCGRSPLSPLTDVDREIAGTYIADLGIERSSSEKIGELCKNDLVLTLLAHAFTREPRTIVLDEPGRFLDLNSLRLLHRTLAKISARAHAAILFCTSDINFASQMSDRIAVIYQGRIVEEGKPSIITAETVRRYFGVDAVMSKNIFNGRPEVHFFPEN
ncbi:MAG TPA: ABC transporter ATP-binding protein [Spirochaetota bacterium]|nr:ABC transporter ATP-binding protein [Spirochaetota bacterium]